MRKICAGIDISMDDFHGCIKIRLEDGSVKIKGTRSFKNNRKGHEEFLEWVLKTKGPGHSCPIRFVMEATGVYYEDLAYFLYKKDQEVSVVLANKIKNYIKSLHIKTKTDSMDSKHIAGYGIERVLDRWHPMSPMYKKLRDLCRELLSFKKELQRSKCQLHAMYKSHEKLESIIGLKIEQMEFYEKAIQTIKKEIKNTVDQDKELKKKIEKVETAPGLGFETIVILIAETNGFALIQNIRQLISYAGLDVTLHESGKYKGKSRISKHGNSRIRQTLYMPSMTATRVNESIRNLYERVCERNPAIKRKGIVAGMRKLLILAYTLWKKEQEYDKDYQWR
ncbi:IS110 family transposase [Sinomicrobium sp. M5D2P9]